MATLGEHSLLEYANFKRCFPYLRQSAYSSAFGYKLSTLMTAFTTYVAVVFQALFCDLFRLGVFQWRVLT